MTRWLLTFVFASIACANASFAQAPMDRGPSLRIESVHPDANSTVEFDVKPLGKVPYNSIAQSPFIDVDMHGGIDRAEIDRTSMKTDPGSHRFSFNLYLNDSSLFTQNAYQYQVDQDPTGVFNDTIQSVNLHIGPDGPSAIVGTVRVPLHSPYGASDAFEPGPIPVQSVRTGSPTSFPLTLKSNLQWLGASLGTPSATVTCGTCLQTPISVQLSTSQLRPADQLIVTVTTVPNMWKAMAASSHPLSDKLDAKLNLLIPFAADGGTSWPQPIAVPIKFSPPLPMMAVSVLGGTLIGAFLRALLLRFAATRWSWREFILGLIIASLTWLIAFFIWSGDTSVKLFGMTFDPTQMFSAFILCVLAGGGPALLKLVDGFFPRIGGNNP